MKFVEIPKFKPWGAPVSFRPSALIVGFLFLAFVRQSFTAGMLALLSYCSIMFVHELGHGFVANRVGCKIIAIRLGSFHGVCEYETPYYEWEDLCIAWGGVAAQLVLAVLALIPLLAFQGHRLGDIELVAYILVPINLLFVIFNLMPFPGLDGYTAWKIIPLYMQRRRANAASKNMLAKIKKRK